MKISELISVLNSHIASKGDLEVFVVTTDIDWDAVDAEDRLLPIKVVVDTDDAGDLLVVSGKTDANL